MASHHSIRGAALALAAALGAASWQAAAQQPAAPAATSTASSYTVFVRARPIGSEQIRVEQSPAGWRIIGSSRLGPPLDLVTRRLEVRYDGQWRPLELSVDAVMRGQFTLLNTTVSETTATNRMTTGDAMSEKTDTIHPESVLLPNPFFAPYEALARRLHTAKAGSEIPAYIAPQGTIKAVVGESTSERIETLERLIEARRTRVSLTTPGSPPLDVYVWGDEAGQLLRISVPAQSLEVVREDIASVSTRRVTVTRAGDESVRVPANGFSLAGTVSKPAGGPPRRPAVVLVGGSGPTDRDETVSGVPILGQLANALADAGYLVLRYDKRGVGQSGGRPEAATLADYAEDVRAAVRFLAARRDVDRDRIAVVGHSEGGAVAMLAAQRERRIAGLVLIATPGVTGAELNMAQVRHGLEIAKRSQEQQQATIELQKKIQNAVLTGQGWDDIPAGLRVQADTPWFQSFLAFDPARVMRDVRQPVLIVQPLLDTQVAPSNADRLEEMARARRRNVTVDVVRLPGLNHLLVPAATGEVAEYSSLTERTIAEAVPERIAAWLEKTFAAVG
jgi:pimeloyl-ACP methyl ester carboxylesterase